MRKTKNKVYHFTLSGGDVLRVFIFFYVVFFFSLRENHVYDNDQTSEANWAPYETVHQAMYKQ
jgi:hypothetical protein